MRSDFEPIYLQDAKRHIEWLYEKLKKNRVPDVAPKKEKIGLFKKFVEILKRVF